MSETFLCAEPVVTESASENPAPVTYKDLKRQLRQAFARGRDRTAEAVERERVRTCWEAGKLIHEYILLNEDRAEYDKEIIKQLSQDLQISETELYYMLRFARAYPILPHAAKLTWGEYRDLLTVKDAGKRERITQEALKKNWSRETLRREIKRIKAADPAALNESLADELLFPFRGSLYTYRVVTAEKGPWKDKLVLDLGFSSQYRPSGVFPFQEGEIVQGAPAEVSGSELKSLPELSSADLFTYRAWVLEVTDGDSVPRKTAQEMRVGPSEPICGNGFQSALSGFG